MVGGCSLDIHGFDVLLIVWRPALGLADVTSIGPA
jgi:hypothetical protein